MDAHAGRGDDRRPRERTPPTWPTARQRVRLASLIQFTVPGAPTVYYGDEVGVTGDDDPDDRRTYPWADLGVAPDTALRARYTSLSALRHDVPVLRTGDFRALLADDTDGVAAYGRKTAEPGGDHGRQPLRRPPQTVSMPVDGYLREGHGAHDPARAGQRRHDEHVGRRGQGRRHRPGQRRARARDGDRRPRRPGRPDQSPRDQRGGPDGSASPGTRSRAPPRTTSGPARSRAAATPRSTRARSPTTSVHAHGPPERVARVRRRHGQRRGRQRERVLEPGQGASRSTSIGWANLQWPPTLTHVISATDRTDNVYGQVWIDGVTSQPGATVGLRAQAGLRAGRVRPGDERCLDVGRRHVQHRRRQQRRVRRVVPARDDRELRLRLPLLDDQRPRPGCTRISMARSRPAGTAVEPGCDDGQPERRHRRADRADRPVGRGRVARGHRADVGRRRRPDALRVRGPARRRLGRAVHDAARSCTTAGRTRTPRWTSERDVLDYVVRAVDQSFNRSAPSRTVDGDGGAADGHAPVQRSRCRRGRTAAGGRRTSPASSTVSTAASRSGTRAASC